MKMTKKCIFCTLRNKTSHDVYTTCVFCPFLSALCFQASYRGVMTLSKRQMAPQTHRQSHSGTDCNLI